MTATGHRHQRRILPQSHSSHRGTPTTKLMAAVVMEGRERIGHWSKGHYPSLVSSRCPYCIATTTVARTLRIGEKLKNNLLNIVSKASPIYNICMVFP
jgi:hypothetical protein